MRHGRVWLFPLLTLAGIGWAGAHAFAHRLVLPSAPRGEPFGLQAYLGYLPTSLALCFALALVLAAGVAAGRRWRGLSGRSLWLFGAVPVLGFLSHGLVEPLVAGHGPSTAASASAASLVHVGPAVLVGLLVQVPLALAAVALARRFFAVAESLAAALVGPSAAAGRGPTPAFRLPCREAERLPAAVIRPGRPRGPPPSPLARA